MAASASKKLLVIADAFRDQVDALHFDAPVAWVYNPLRYAWKPHSEYLKRFTPQSCRVLFLGMNPGPFGMAQTGVPFGEIPAVRDWIGIDEPVEQPLRVHPKRPIEGFLCKKSEVSGRRLWGLFAKKFGDSAPFFQNHFVANYCPLVFMDEGGRNVTPDKLQKTDAKRLESVCDEHLKKMIDILRPEFAIGVGAYAMSCFHRCIGSDSSVVIGKILHPSPASPAANRDWEGQATQQLKELGVW